VRPQPRHSFEPGSSTQIFRQGDSMAGIAQTSEAEQERCRNIGAAGQIRKCQAPRPPAAAAPPCSSIGACG
jgi:hypothetical protein